MTEKKPGLVSDEVFNDMLAEDDGDAFGEWSQASLDSLMIGSDADSLPMVAAAELVIPRNEAVSEPLKEHDVEQVLRRARRTRSGQKDHDKSERTSRPMKPAPSVDEFDTLEPVPVPAYQTRKPREWADKGFSHNPFQAAFAGLIEKNLLNALQPNPFLVNGAYCMFDGDDGEVQTKKVEPYKSGIVRLPQVTLQKPFKTGIWIHGARIDPAFENGISYAGTSEPDVADVMALDLEPLTEISRLDSQVAISIADAVAYGLRGPRGLIENLIDGPDTALYPDGDPPPSEEDEEVDNDKVVLAALHVALDN